jgi:hypothetical protein
VSKLVQVQPKGAVRYGHTTPMSALQIKKRKKKSAVEATDERTVKPGVRKNYIKDLNKAKAFHSFNF